MKSVYSQFEPSHIYGEVRGQKLGASSRDEFEVVGTILLSRYLSLVGLTLTYLLDITEYQICATKYRGKEEAVWSNGESLDGGVLYLDYGVLHLDYGVLHLAANQLCDFRKFIGTLRASVFSSVKGGSCACFVGFQNRNNHCFLAYRQLPFLFFFFFGLNA